jgi:hypothetical protein
MAKAKHDIRTGATRPIYAGVGVTDLAVGKVRAYVADVQRRINGLDLEPSSLRDEVVTVVTAGVDIISKDARARRAAVEARVAELQAALNENVAALGDTYADLARRGEVLVGRIRSQQSTRATVSSARTAEAKAKTTRTQATKAAKTTARTTARKASTTAKTSSTAPKASATATATAAKRTATNTADAATDAAAKVGD